MVVFRRLSDSVVACGALRNSSSQKTIRESAPPNSVFPPAYPAFDVGDLGVREAGTPLTIPPTAVAARARSSLVRDTLRFSAKFLSMGKPTALLTATKTKNLTSRILWTWPNFFQLTSTLPGSYPGARARESRHRQLGGFENSQVSGHLP